MQNDRMLLVLGPRSSGTRLMTRILIAAGAKGDPNHEQRFDLVDNINKLPEGLGTIVWRRSYPHFNNVFMPRIEELQQQIDNYPIDHIFIMVRDVNAMAISAATNRQGGDDYETSIKKINLAYSLIFHQINELFDKGNKIDFTIINYECLDNEKYISWFCSRAGLGEPRDIEEIKIQNEKYYKDI